MKNTNTQSQRIGVKPGLLKKKRVTVTQCFHRLTTTWCFTSFFQYRRQYEIEFIKGNPSSVFCCLSTCRYKWGSSYLAEWSKSQRSPLKTPRYVPVRGWGTQLQKQWPVSCGWMHLSKLPSISSVQYGVSSKNLTELEGINLCPNSDSTDVMEQL